MLAMRDREKVPGFRPGRPPPLWALLQVRTYWEFWYFLHNCPAEYFSSAPWGARPADLTLAQLRSLQGGGVAPRPTKRNLDAFERVYGPLRMRLAVLDIDRCPHDPWTDSAWEEALHIIARIPLLQGMYWARTRRGLRVGIPFTRPMGRADDVGAKRLALTLILNLEIARVVGVQLDPVLAAHGARGVPAKEYLAGAGLPFYAEPRSADPVPEHTAAVGALARHPGFIPYVHEPEFPLAVDVPGLEPAPSSERAAAYELATRPSDDEVRWDSLVPAQLPPTHQRVAEAIDQGLQRIPQGQRHPFRLAIAGGLLGTNIATQAAYDIYRVAIGPTNPSGDDLVGPFRSSLESMARGGACTGLTWLRQHKMADVASAIATLGRRGLKDPLAPAKAAQAKFGPDGRLKERPNGHPDDLPDIEYRHHYGPDGEPLATSADLVSRRTLADARRHLRQGYGEVLVLAAPTGTGKTRNALALQREGVEELGEPRGQPIYVACSNRQGAEYQGELDARSRRVHSMLGECPEVQALATAYGRYRRQAPEIRQHIVQCDRCQQHDGVTRGASLGEQRRLRRVAAKIGARLGLDEVMLDNVFPHVSWGRVLRAAGFTAAERRQVLRGKGVAPGRHREFGSLEEFRGAALAVAPGRVKELDEELRWAGDAVTEGQGHSHGRIGVREEWSKITGRQAKLLKQVDESEGVLIANQGSLAETESQWGDSRGIILDDITALIEQHTLTRDADADDYRTARVVLSDTKTDVLGGVSPREEALKFIAEFRKALPTVSETRTMLAEEMATDGLKAALPGAKYVLGYAQSAKAAGRDEVEIFAKRGEGVDAVTYAREWARFWDSMNLRVAIAVLAFEEGDVSEEEGEDASEPGPLDVDGVSEGGGTHVPGPLEGARLLIRPSDRGPELCIDGPTDFARTIVRYVEQTGQSVILCSATPGLAPDVLRQLGLPVRVQRYDARVQPGVRVRPIKIVAALSKRRIERTGWSRSDLGAVSAALRDLPGDVRSVMVHVWMSQEPLFAALMRQVGTKVIVGPGQDTTEERDAAVIEAQAQLVGEVAVGAETTRRVEQEEPPLTDSERAELARRAWDDRLALWVRVLAPLRGHTVHLRHHRGSTGLNEGQDAGYHVGIGDPVPPPDGARRRVEYARGRVPGDSAGWGESHQEARDSLTQDLVGRARVYRRGTPATLVQVGSGELIPEGVMALAELRLPDLPSGLEEGDGDAAERARQRNAQRAAGAPMTSAELQDLAGALKAREVGAGGSRRKSAATYLATALRVDPTTVRRWFTGAAAPDTPALTKVHELADELGQVGRFRRLPIYSKIEGDVGNARLSEKPSGSEYLKIDRTSEDQGLPSAVTSSPITVDRLLELVGPSTLTQVVGCSPRELARTDRDPFVSFRLAEAARTAAVITPTKMTYDSVRLELVLQDSQARDLARAPVDLLRDLGLPLVPGEPLAAQVAQMSWPPGRHVVTVLRRVVGLLPDSRPVPEECA